MFQIDVDDVVSRIPVDVTEEQERFVRVRIADSVEAIREAFMRRGRDFDRELDTVPWLDSAAKRVVREMVAAAVMVGPDVHVRSQSSTTGPQADSITYNDNGNLVRFGSVWLTDEMLEALGLTGRRGARGSFPPPARWPERREPLRRWW